MNKEECLNFLKRLADGLTEMMGKKLWSSSSWYEKILNSPSST